MDRTKRQPLIGWAAVLLLLAAPARGATTSKPHLPPGTNPLAVGTPDGRGPLALVNLNHVVLGWTRIYGGQQPDLFVAGHGGPPAVYLFRWAAQDASGAPVFAEPRDVRCAFTEKGAVFQSADGVVHGLWIVKEEIVHTVFDQATCTFQETQRISLGKSLRGAQSLAALANADGSYDLAFEMSDGGRGPEGHPGSETWRPYNTSGIAAGQLPYRYLYGARLPALLRGPLEEPRQITPTQHEVYYRMHQLTALNLRAGHTRDLATGSRQGNLLYYRNPAAVGWQLEPRRLIAGEDGNALRHPSINASVVAYPNAESGLSDLIACGEGGLYFYRFTGRFTSAGAPIYQQPVPVLQEHAALYAGTLPTPTVVDFNGDGRLDLVVGNSEGFILFFQNTGSNDRPRWLPGTRVQAGARDIQVQAGYAGSLQGLQEARWGYVSPNVIDWNGDGLPDIITGDITGNFQIYLNRGTPRQPQLEPARPLYCDGLDLHGMWRVRPAAARLGDRMALALVDGDDHFHLYWRIDDYNVADGGKLLLADGNPIGASGGIGGQSGRCKLDFFDWDGDGRLDLIVGTARVNAIPDRQTGLPMPTLGQRTLGTPLWLRNVGTNTAPKFARPAPFRDAEGEVIQPGGAHETGVVGTSLGGRGPNLLVGNEAGQLFLLPRSQLRIQEPK